MQRLNWPELAFGLFLFVLAGVVLFAGRTLDVGTAADMGPGWVPRALALIILGSGAIQIARGFITAARPLPSIAWRPLLAILAAGGVFAIALPALGLFAAAVLAMVTAAPAAPPVRPLECALFALAVATFCAVLFVKLLGLPLQLWPW